MKFRICIIWLMLSMTLITVSANGISEYQNLSRFDTDSKMEWKSMIPITFCQGIIRSSQMNFLFAGSQEQERLGPVYLSPQYLEAPDPQRMISIGFYSDDQIDSLISKYCRVGIPQGENGELMDRIPRTLVELSDSLHNISEQISPDVGYISDSDLQFLLNVCPEGWSPNGDIYDSFRMFAKALSHYLLGGGEIPSRYYYKYGSQ